MSAALDAALAYIGRGWSVVPVGYREKGPKLKDWHKLQITAETPGQYLNGGKQNIGVILGPASDGLTDVDFDCPEALAVGSRFLPAGAEAIFGRASSRASHYLFITDLASTEGKTVIAFDDPMRSGKEARLLEIRIGAAGAGAQTIVPPSTHKDTGEEICWECDGAPPRIDGAVLKRAMSLAAFACLILRYMIGARHDAFLELGGFLARCGFTPANVKLIASAIVDGGKLERDHIGHAVDACKVHHDGKNSYGYPKLVEIFGDKVAGKCADWLGVRPHVDVPSAEARDGAPSEVDLADAFTDRHGGDWRYGPEWGRWYRFSGSVWIKENIITAFGLARGIRVDAVAHLPPRAAKQTKKAATIAAVERLAREDCRVRADADQWDADPWLLNTPVGTVDLRTGILREARREDYMSKITAAAPGGECAMWLEFLRRVANDDSELTAYLQRLAGYSLTGETGEHSLNFFYGPGGNGKGVFLNTLTGILGDYAIVADIATFTESPTDRHPTDLAMLRGARLSSRRRRRTGGAGPHGLRPPASVLAATEEYFEDEDATGLWIEECCYTGAQSSDSSKSLFASWTAWVTASGTFVGSRKAFGQRLEGVMPIT